LLDESRFIVPYIQSIEGELLKRSEAGIVRSALYVIGVEVGVFLSCRSVRAWRAGNQLSVCPFKRFLERDIEARRQCSPEFEV
jgi:hypothetical protein